MATKTQKIRVGLFAAVSATLLAIVLVVFGGVRFWAKTDTYRIEIDDTAYGLQEGAKVHFNGIRVGTVTDLRLADDQRRVAVTIAVKRGTPVRTDTKAIMKMAGITGLKEIDLVGGDPAAQPLAAGSTIPQGETFLDKLEARAEQIADQSTKLMERANQLVENLVAISDPKDYEALRESAKLTADNLAQASATLRGMVGENRVALRESIESINATAKSASEILDKRVSSLVGRADNLVGQLDGMVRDNQGGLRAAVFDLRQASRSFKDLAREVRQRPSRLLFSKPPADRKLP